MKTIRFIMLFGICLLFANSRQMLFAQSVPLLNPDNMWSVLQEENFYPGFPDERVYKLSYRIKTGNDTVVNGKKYKIMLYSMDRESLNWEDHIDYILHDNERVPIGGVLMREEGGKVYSNDGRIYYNEEETLLYDFNLQEGDSISSYLFPYVPDRDDKIISRVDSIRYTHINNLPRKVFYISIYPENNPGFKVPEIWIEGIGSSLRLNRTINNYYLWGSPITWNLLCFYQNGKLLYHSPDFSDCYYHWVLGNPKVDSNLDFQVYPNPSSGKFTVQSGAENGNSQVQVFDMNGKQIRSYRLDDSGYLEVDLSNVSRGTYLVRLLKPGFSGTKKIVIN
ncbi:MAG: T9SS type A sorting domain-containing protein [Dysgonamonadaceae bacterium]|nr:T9SS type A sorting domain-containing protein [Dysgonamonadaceae bacterium]